MRGTSVVLGTWILTGALAVPAQAPAPPDTHSFTVDDLVAMDRVAAPLPSPDGRRIAFVVSAVDLGGLTVSFSADNHQASNQVFLTQIRDGKIAKLK